MPTQLSEYCALYRGIYGQRVPPRTIRRLAPVTHELEGEYPREQCLAHYRRYCLSTPLKFYSAERFGETFDAWGPPTHSVVRLPYQRTVDDCDRAALIPLPGEQ